MPDPLEHDLQNEAPVVGNDYRSLQRAALQAVLRLSRTAVEPVEHQIEQRYRASREDADRTYEQAAREIEARYQELKVQAEQQFGTHVAQIEDLQQSNLDTLERNHQTALEGIRSDAAEVITRAKKELDDTLWMADTVARSSLEAAKDSHTKTRAYLAEARQRLTAFREHVDSWLDRYGHAPVETAESADAPPESNDLDVSFQQIAARIVEQLGALETLKWPWWFMGAFSYLSTVSLAAAAAGLMVLLDYMQVPYWPSAVVAAPLTFVGTAALVVIVGRTQKRNAHIQVHTIAEVLRSEFANANRLIDQQGERAGQRAKADEAKGRQAQHEEIQAARHAFDAAVAAATQKQEESHKRLEEAYTKRRAEVQRRREDGLMPVDADIQQRFRTLQEKFDRGMAAVRQQHEAQLEECQREYESARAALHRRWDEEIAWIQRLLEHPSQRDRYAVEPSTEESWSNWTPPEAFVSTIPLGHWRVDLTQLAGSVRQRASFLEGGPESLSTPALLSLPDRCSLLVQSGREGRSQAIDLLRTMMLRLLISLPPGRVHFIVIDPVGLGENFAGFMHLTDYEEAIIGVRIWTDAEHIEKQLADLTNHMENVIQKYLRNEFPTIDAYNAQAGELAEPYRFLVIADFPVNINEEAARRLSSVISSGARCGVYSLIAHDTRHDVPSGIQIEDIQAGSVHLVYENGSFVWQDHLFRKFPLSVDPPPSEETLTRIMHAVGQAAKDSLRVEVPFETVAPPPEQYWSRDSRKGLRVPIGRSGAVRLQELQLGRGVTQHVLLAGKTGSGKSTLLHVIVTNLALWYSPDEVELYLVDFKKGVEFKTYVTHALAHARAIAIESDREFGLSVLQRLDAEMAQRGELFRREGVQDLAAYRESTGARMPRTLLIVDEFQVFFSEDDRLSQDASVLLDRLVRQGRAFGIHVLLGSQTLGGASGLARSTMGQMAVRIALHCSEADSQLILDDTNVAARLLSRPGEAIYNDAGGLVEGNNPFQTAWLPDDHQETFLDRVRDLARDRLEPRDPPIVFEGNAPADVQRNRILSRLIEKPEWSTPPVAPRIWLGEAVAIKDPTCVTFRRQSGANLFLVGQHNDAALAMMAVAMVSLAAQYGPQRASFMVFDGRPADAPDTGYFQRVAASLPHATRVVEWRDVAAAIGDLATELQRRQDADQTDAPAIYVMILGLQRYRMLRRSEADYSFSMDDEGKPPALDRQFAELLREGPSYGMHVLTWADTPASLQRTLDREALSLFDNRVLFQISAADSSNLIDSPAANTLGFHRALLYSEEQGTGEKFRPYAVPDASWLEQVGRLLNKEAAARPRSEP
ncbi:MAG: cell division protein FtsK [Phycisphaerae bacterium]|nr:cell division protein FtsK [Phycisphaerae bacterium]